MNLRDQKSYRDKYYKGYLRAFTEAHIARQNPEAQARMRKHNDKVRIARLVSKAQRKAKKEDKEREREALRTQRLSAKSDRRGRSQAA